MFGTELSFKFRLFGIPVQASLFFLLLAVILGQRAAKGSPMLLATWVAIVFASVLLHELGHALMARAFGNQPYVMLYGLGGVTAWRERRPLTAGRRFVVSLAGPAVGLVIGTLALGFFLALPDKQSRQAAIVSYIVFANLGWGILNLIPMLPLDGGQIAAALIDLVAPGRGPRGARYLSILVALVVAPLAILGGLFLLAVYCALSVWMNVQELRSPPTPPAPAVIDVPAQPVSEDQPPPPRPS